MWGVKQTTATGPFEQCNKLRAGNVLEYLMFRTGYCKVPNGPPTNIAYERFFVLSFIVCARLIPFYESNGESSCARLIIPNQQMNLGGKMDKEKR